MSDTKENMEKRVVSLASSGVIGYYIFSKLNAAQDTVEMPDDGLNLPPALKEATFYEGGIVSVESVKRMSEIIAEQARVYAATIRNGIRTPIVVEDEQPEENMYEEETYEEPSFEENDTEIYDEVEENPASETMFDEPVMDDVVMDDITPDDDISLFDDTAAEEVENEATEEPVADEDNEEPIFEEPAVEEEPATEEAAQTVFVPVNAPMTFADMGGFEGLATMPVVAEVAGADNGDANGVVMPVSPVFGEGGLEIPVAPVAGEGTMPVVEFEEPAAQEEPVLEEQPTLMENIEPLHKVEEEEDPRNSEKFKSIADFLNTL